MSARGGCLPRGSLHGVCVSAYESAYIDGVSA